MKSSVSPANRPIDVFDIIGTGFDCLGNRNRCLGPQTAAMCTINGIGCKAMINCWMGAEASPDGLTWWFVHMAGTMPMAQRSVSSRPVKRRGRGHCTRYPVHARVKVESNERLFFWRVSSGLDARNPLQRCCSKAKGGAVVHEVWPRCNPYVVSSCVHERQDIHARMGLIWQRNSSRCLVFTRKRHASRKQAAGFHTCLG